MKFNLKSRIWSSIKFGFIHMIVGVPVYVAILLCFIGYIFSIKYVMAFKKNFEINDRRFAICDEDAINAATSLHAKFNFIIISLVLITLIILQFTK